MCCFPLQPTPSNQTLAQVPLPPGPCLASTSFLAEGCTCSLCTAANVLIPLCGSSRVLCRPQSCMFFPQGFSLWGPGRQPNPQRQPLSWAQRSQMASANHWLNVTIRQMDAMCLAHESSLAAKATANSGLDFCSYAREIPPTCPVVLIWHSLLMKTLV